MWLSHVSLNLFVHDTFYVVAHFHFLFSSATFSAIFAAIFHYFYIIFNYKYNKILAYYFLFFWNLGQWLTFIPLFWVGYNGLPRRYHDYNEIYAIWQSLSSTGHTFSLISVFFFFLIILESQVNKNCPLYFSIIKLKPYKRLTYFILKQKNKKKQLFFIVMLNSFKFFNFKIVLFLAFSYLLFFSYFNKIGVCISLCDYDLYNCVFFLTFFVFLMIFFINRFVILKSRVLIFVYIIFVPCMFFLIKSNSFLVFFLNYEFLLLLSAIIFKLSTQNKRSFVVLYYFILWTQLGSFLVFLGFVYSYSITNTVCFLAIKNFNFHNSQFSALKWLFLVGFGIKLPLWPFSFWLAKTHVEAPSSFSIFLSGVLVKTALVGLLKLNFLFFFSKNNAVLFIFIISFFGSTFKLFVQTDFKKLIAYTTIQEMSLLILFSIFNGFSNYNILKFFIVLHTLTSLQFFLINDIVFLRFLNRQCSFFLGLSYSLPKLSFFLLTLFFLFIGLPFSLKFFIEFFFIFKALSFNTSFVFSLVCFLQYLSVIFFSKCALPFFFGKKNFTVFDITNLDFLIMSLNFFLLYFFFFNTFKFLVFTTIKKFF